MRRVALLTLLLLLAGCHKSLDSQVEGSWTEKRGGSGVELLIQAFVPKVKLKINPDHTFALDVPSLDIEVHENSSSVKVQDRIEGTWSATGDTVSFQVKTIKGKPLDEIHREIKQQQDQADANKRLQAMNDAIQRQQVTQSQAYDMYGQPIDNSETPQPVSPPSTGNTGISSPVLDVSAELVLPQSAQLTKEGLTLRYQDNVSPPVDLVKE